MKLSNFASLDPNHQTRGVKGLRNSSKADKDAWRDFTNNWEQTAVESEFVLHQLVKSGSAEGNISESTAIWQNEVGETEAERSVKVRIGQDFFRKTVLSSYRSHCCICGISIPALLIASHIIPWRDRNDLRLNPHNGLCLCALHDKAFDNGYIAVNANYRVLVSIAIDTYLPNESLTNNFANYAGATIMLPDKFAPNRDFLEYHYTEYFRK